MSGYLGTQLKTEDTGQVAAGQSARFQSVYGTLISNLADGPVLDIGPGRGELLEVLLDTLVDGNNRVFSIDIDDEVVGHIEKHYPDAVALHGDPVEILGSDERLFSAVFMLHVLEHLDVDYAVKLLTEIRHHLAPGGSLVIEVPNSACSYVGDTIFSSDVTHKTPYTSVSLKQICRMAGFEQITVAGIRPKGYGLARMAQRTITAVLIAVDRLLHKIYLPSWSFLHEATIYAVCIEASSVECNADKD